jgi:hypothetical protein
MVALFVDTQCKYNFRFTLWRQSCEICYVVSLERPYYLMCKSKKKKKTMDHGNIGLLVDYENGMISVV